MVAMVVSLTAITSVYSLGSAMSQQFYEETRVATAQGSSRVAIMELRRDISRAGLFGSPNGDLEPSCDPLAPTLPTLDSGPGPMGAFQYYADYDNAVLDPDTVNGAVHADRLRILTSLYLTDQLLIHSASIDGSVVVLQAGNQAYRRTFSWGQAAGPFTGSTPDYLGGNLTWDSAWGGETASWKGIAQNGARAFQTGSVLHIETPEGRHFFRSVFGKAGNTEDEVRMQITPDLPIGTACLPGAAEGASVAPLQWVEYALVDPFDAAEVGADFMDFDGMFYIDLDPTHPSFTLQGTTAADLIESRTPSPNMVLVRRVLDATDQSVRPNSTQVIAEFVSNFEVSFILDTASGTGVPNLTSELHGASAMSDVNADPQQVRSVIINLGVRSPIEDPSIAFDPALDTRFEVDQSQDGSARVRQMRIEIPVMNVARKNL
jgi:hypothetical protein